jgi:hypothetical protein
MANHRLSFQGEDLTHFRYHTGATLRPLLPGEPCRLLFRDIGPVAMAEFLRGRLRRLAGPFAPILYTRTADYQEPYVDHERIGRLVFLKPGSLHPWHSGVPTIYVASIRQRVDPRTVMFIPGSLDLHEAESRLQGVGDAQGLRESLGDKLYDEIVADSLASLDCLNRELEETERLAEPLRRRFQSRQRNEAESARSWMARHGLLETDLCTAWHHLPRERRDLLREALRSREEEPSC